MAIQDKLAAENPAVTDFRSRLAVSHNNLGVLLRQTGQSTEAEAELCQALELCGKLAADNPMVPEYRNMMASPYTHLAELARARGRLADARDGYDRAIALRERLARDDPKTTIYRSFLAFSLRRRGLARAGLGDGSGAAVDARRALELYDGLPSRSGEDWSEAACCHAALAGLAGRGGPGLSAAEASVEAEAAMVLLHKAVAMGYRDIGAFRAEAALDPLRDRADFRLLMMDLMFPAEAFARDE